MSMTNDDIFVQALELPKDDRAQLASILIRSLDDDEPDPNRDVALAAEIEGRMRRLDSGDSQTIRAEEVIEQLRQLLRRSRKS